MLEPGLLLLAEVGSIRSTLSSEQPGEGGGKPMLGWAGLNWIEILNQAVFLCQSTTSGGAMEPARGGVRPCFGVPKKTHVSPLLSPTPLPVVELPHGLVLALPNLQLRRRGEEDTHCLYFIRWSRTRDTPSLPDVSGCSPVRSSRETQGTRRMFI